MLALALTAANLSGLLMLRTLDRSRELAVRAALGATRTQIVRQVLMESHAVVLAGTAGGALLTLWMTPVAARLVSDHLGVTVSASGSWRAFGALAVMAVGCAWATAAAPAITALRRRREIRVAERLFNDARGNARMVWLQALGGPAEVIGIVADIKHRALDETDVPTAYFSALQQPSRSSHVVMRTSDPTSALQVLRAEVGRLDPWLPVYAPGTLADVVDASPGVGVRRVIATTFGAFAVLGLIIAAVGVFGIVAHDVSRRRRELAVRLALGASPRRLQREVVMQGLGMLGLGVAGGLLLWLALAPGLRAVLYETSPGDSSTLLAAIAILACCALGAVVIPARHIARMSPFSILRGE